MSRHGKKAAGSGTASAVPGNLYDYAAKSVSGMQDLLAFARSLPGYITAYQQTAIDYGHEIFGGGESAGTGTLDATLLKVLGEVAATEHWVASVGKEFEEAGRNSGGTPPSDALPGLPGATRSDPFGLGWRTSAIHTTDSALDSLASSDGAALAAQLERALDAPGGPDLGPFFDQLRATGLDDPQFDAGFFNHLTPAQVSGLLQYKEWQSADLNARHAFPTGLRDLLTAFASAEASGRLDPGKERLIVQSLRDHDRGGDLVTPLLQALGENPDAAVAFARAHPPQDLRPFFTHAPAEQQAAYLEFLRADLQGDPKQADSLLALVKSLLITYPEGQENQPDHALLTVTSGGYEEMSPQLAAFLRTYLAVRTGKPSAHLVKWDDRITDSLDALAPFYSAMANTGDKEHEDFETSSEWAKAFMTTVLLAGGGEVGVEFLPEGFELFEGLKYAKYLRSALIGGEVGGGVFAAEPTVTRWIFGVEAEEGEEPAHVFRKAMERYARLTAMARLAHEGRIHLGRDGHAVSWKKLTGGRGAAGLVPKVDHVPEDYWVVYPDGTRVALKVFLKSIHVED